MRAPRVGKKERKGEEREGSEEEKEAKKEKEKSSAARGKKGEKENPSHAYFPTPFQLCNMM